MNQSKIVERYAGLQDRLNGIDSDGCFFLALCTIAEEVNGSPIDLIDAVNTCYRAKLIADKYTVQDATMILGVLTGKQWTVKKAASLEKEVIGEHDYTIVVFENPMTKIRHFRRRYVDTLVDSQTVKYGTPIEYRIYTWR